jgi:hypothetical protein
MEYTCHRHASVAAAGTCHSCGKHFCEECLTQGMENSYCSDSDCRDQRVRDEAFIVRRYDEVEALIQRDNKDFDAKVLKGLLALWVIVAPVFVYFGSDQWTRNQVVASIMGVIGSLVLCMQLRSLIAYFRRKHLDRLRVELIENWVQKDVE